MDQVLLRMHNPLVRTPNFKASIMGNRSYKSEGTVVSENGYRKSTLNGVINGTLIDEFSRESRLRTNNKKSFSQPGEANEEISFDEILEPNEDILEDALSSQEDKEVPKPSGSHGVYHLSDESDSSSNSSSKCEDLKTVKDVTVAALYSHRTLRRMCRDIGVKMRVSQLKPETQCTSNHNSVKPTSASPISTAGNKVGIEKPPAANNEDSDESSEEYEIEDIVDHSLEKGVDWYFVKWKNWSSDHNTWEPKSHLTGCENLMEAFHTSRLNRKRKSPFVSEEFHSKRLKISSFISDLCKGTSDSDIAVLLKLGKVKLDEFSYSKKQILKLKSKIRAKYVTCSRDRRNRNLRRLLEKESDLFGELGLIQYASKRKEVLKNLKDWEIEMNRFYGNSCIVVQNFVDLEGPPKDFTYITNYIPGEGVEIPDDPLVGCQCDDCFENSKKCCPGGAGASFAYYRNGFVSVPAGSPIYECNKLCTCGPDCPNRVVQKGQKVNVIIFRTDDGRGWGVKTMERIKKGTFVMEYNGEVITNEEAERRGTQYDGEGRTYLFDLDYDGSDTFTVDAAFYGNAAHFINHSCDPNLHVYGVWVDHLDTRIPRVAFFTCRDIKKYEELTFDYRMTTGSQSPKKTEEQTSSSTEHNDLGPSTSGRNLYSIKPIQCKCKSSNCRRFLF